MQWDPLAPQAAPGSTIHSTRCADSSTPHQHSTRISVRISSCLCKSSGMGLLDLISKGHAAVDAADGNGRAGEIPSIRWRKGKTRGSSAFGQVYLDRDESGHQQAPHSKSALVGSTNATWEKAQVSSTSPTNLVVEIFLHLR
ncbi:uncharacterized protein [Triticum aestivum]|uniref:uncharacterized protein n=1 Tax=Triticum aestivum TaxID=4565 RepID=UPI001D017115|nr:uncharacterized protein LOC123105645 [Triticum aestivum]XP_044385965.1 uncharacterized protein LOC123108197 [Triticum aestivum]